MSDLMVLELGDVALPFDAQQAAELTKDMAAGFGGGFKRAARLTMGNSGDWELVDSEGNSHELGREVNIVVVAQREFISRIHYAKSFDEMKALGEFEQPDCQSKDGVAPDEGCTNPYSDKCKTCKAFEKSGQSCSYYRRIVAVLASADGTFSDPFVFEPKAKSLFDQTVVESRYGSYGWYMNTLKSQKRNGVAMPIPVQYVVTKCKPMPKMQVATMKFGVASTPAGGYWTLNKEQFDFIMQLKDSDEVKELLEPFNAAHDNPSSIAQIPVMNIDVPPTVQEQAPVEKSEVKTAPAPKPKAPAPKPKAPEPKSAPKAKKKVVLGIEHPDVKESEDFDYEDIVAWAKEADEADVKAWLEDNFPQALEPIEVETEVAEEKPAPKPKAPPMAKKQAVEQAPEPVEKAVDNTDENIIDPSGGVISEEDKQAAKEMAQNLDDFDD